MRALHIIATISITLTLPLCFMAWIAAANSDYQSAYSTLAAAYILMGIALICQTVRNMRMTKEDS